MWHRSFDSTTLESKMEFRDGLMVESFWIGPLGLKMIPASFGFHLQPIKPEGTDAMHYRGFRHITKRMWIFGLPVPRALALTADGTSIQVPTGEKMANNDSAHGWAVKVSLDAPWIGKMLSYDGEVFRN